MILIFIHFLVLAAILWKFKPEKGTLLYGAAWLIRILGGWVIGYIYLIHLQEGDTVVFHHEATQLLNLFQQSPHDYFHDLFSTAYPVYLSEARNEWFVKLLSLFYLIGNGSYWIASMYLATCSFAGVWFFYRCLTKAFPSTSIAALAFLFLPSAVLWTSGVMKDTLASLAVYVFLALTIRHTERSNMRWWEPLLMTLVLLLLFYIKYYLAACCLLLGGTVLLWYDILPLISSIPVKWVLGIGLLLAMTLATSRVNANLHLNSLPKAITENHQLILERSSPANQIHFEGLDGTWEGLVINGPKSLYTGLFRPFPWEGSNLVRWLALENIAILLLFLISLIHFKSWRWHPLWFFGLCFVGILAALLPLVSPNFGTLIRYKAIYAPLWLFLVSIVPVQRFISNAIRFR